MKKLVGMICLFAMLCSMAMPCFATGVDFYADPNDTNVLQVIEKSDTSIRGRLSTYIKRNFSPEKDNIDEEKIEYDLEHVFEWKSISNAQIRELLQTENVQEFVDNLTTWRYRVPAYYDRENNPEPKAFAHIDGKDGKYKFSDVDYWSTELLETCMQNKELTMQKIKEIAGDGYTLLFNFSACNGLWFSLVEKEGVRQLIYMGDAIIIGRQYLDAMPQEYKDMLKSPVWSVEQADEFFPSISI